MTQSKSKIISEMSEGNSKFFQEFLYDIGDEEIIDESNFRIGYVPYMLKRKSDGDRLKLNLDNKTYSYVKTHGAPNCEYTWSWGRLFADHRCKDAFEVIAWVKVDNLDSVHEFFNKKNKEHENIN